ncbi:hypothetical protein IAI18_03350 [Acetobacteraceae bacterium H6797]|nr:hypothetical protein [Acetobacteraceae bacterium H6797]
MSGAKATGAVMTGWEDFWAGGPGAPLEAMGPPAPPRAHEPGLAQRRARDLSVLREAEAALEKVRGISQALRAEFAAWRETGLLGQGPVALALDEAEAARYGQILEERLSRSDAWVAQAERELCRVKAQFASAWGVVLAA